MVGQRAAGVTASSQDRALFGRPQPGDRPRRSAFVGVKLSPNTRAEYAISSLASRGCSAPPFSRSCSLVTRCADCGLRRALDPTGQQLQFDWAKATASSSSPSRNLVVYCTAALAVGRWCSLSQRSAESSKKRALMGDGPQS